jgi:hypothetical protein
MNYSADANPFLQGDSSIRSLNRARVVSLPGPGVDSDVIGKTGYELLSAHAVRQELASHAAALHLDGNRPDLFVQFDRCFYNPATQGLAREIAHAYGRRLGFFLLMLKRADPENRAARPEWDARHWQFWQRIGEIVLGGGMIAGQFGSNALPAAQKLLLDYGCSDLTITRSAYAAHLPLVGLARTAHLHIPTMLVLDFGQTSVKRGVALYQGDSVAALQVLPAVPAVCHDLIASEQTDVQRRLEEMLTIVEETWRRVAPAWGNTTVIGMSLACYLFAGHPSPHDRGCYGSLQMLAPHLATFLQIQVRQRLQVNVELHVVHDGTAAAAVYAGQKDTAVLTLGTAIGNGFPPDVHGYRPLAPTFQVHS